MNYYTLEVANPPILTRFDTPEERDQFALNRFNELTDIWDVVNVVKIDAPDAVVTGCLHEYNA